MLKDVIMALIALILSLLLVPGVAKLAVKIGAVDQGQMPARCIQKLCHAWVGWPFMSASLLCCF